MPKVNFREEVLNVALAELLEQRGMLSVPETIRKSIVRTRNLPDILVGDLLGVRIVIEGRFDSGKSSSFVCMIAVAVITILRARS